MKKTTNKNDISNDDLALMIGKGFEEVHNKIDNLKKELKGELNKEIGEVKKDLVDLKENLKATRSDILNTGDRYVSRYEFDTHLTRFSKLEEKVGGNKNR